MDGNLELVLVYRPYEDMPPVNDELRDLLGENEPPVVNESPKLVVPRKALCQYAPGDLERVRQRIAYQDKLYAEENPDVPLLNRIRYVRRPFEEAEVEFDSASGTATLAYENKGPNTQSFFLDPSVELVYDLQSDEKRLRTKMDYSSFMRAFRQIVSYLTNAEKTSYEEVLRGRMLEDEFMQIADGYIRREYVQAGRLAVEDLATMREKVHCALFEMYVLQSLIDDENITDIKITSPYSIRVRVKGKAYASNVNFIDYSDYARFINALTITSPKTLTFAYDDGTLANEAFFSPRSSLTYAITYTIGEETKTTAPATLTLGDAATVSTLKIKSDIYGILSVSLTCDNEFEGDAESDITIDATSGT